MNASTSRRSSAVRICPKGGMPLPSMPAEQHVVALAEPGRVADEVGRREAGNTATAAVGLVAPTRGRCVAL
jgi:hypothetical protein